MSRAGFNRRAIIGCALAVLLALGVTAAAAALNKQQSVHRAAEWLSQTSVRTKMSSYSGVQADAIDALLAAKRARGGVTRAEIDAYADDVEQNALDYSNTAGATAKLTLAAVSSLRNPRCFGAKGEELDLLGLLGTYYDSRTGQFGTTSFDQALAMIALAAVRPNIEQRKWLDKAAAFVRSRRGPNGWGFSLAKAPGDDVDTTAMLIQALRAAGVPRSDKGLKGALAWLRLQRNSSGGFNPGGSGRVTQANSTALAIQAARAMGSADRRALRALRGLQRGSGAFGSFKSAAGTIQNQAVATVDALIAVSGARRPVKRRSSPPRNPCN